MAKLLIAILSILFGIALSQTGNYPASGLYVGINSNFLMQEGNTLTTYAQNELLNTQFPDISGSSSDVTYDFHSFKLALTLEDIFYNELSSGLFQIGWQTISFNFQWNYHICAHKVIHPCEDGTINVFTTSGQTASIATNLDILFNATQTSISAIITQFVFDQGAVEINVHCSNSICIIPVKDIANEVAQNFNTELTNGITKAINEKADTIAALFTPIKQIPMTLSNGDSFWIDLEGQLVEQSNPVANIPTITAAFNGGVILENTDGNFVYPSQTPSYIPTDSQMESFETDYQVTMTGFLIESLCDAAFASMLPLTINPNEVPAASPVHLNTSDGFFSGVAPGLSAYPNQGIQVSVYSPITPVVTINSTSISLNTLQLSADFIILDDPSNPITAFTVLFTIDADISTSVNLVNEYTFSLNSTLMSLTPNATISSSSIGTVDASGFVQLMQMLQSVIKLPSLVYSVPSKYSLTDVNLSLGDQVIQIAFDLAVASEQQKNNRHHSIINFN